MTRRYVLLGAFLLAALFGSTAMAVEEPAFTIVRHVGNVEIRDYPALVVAEVAVTGDQKEAASKGFRLLAGYIFGGNKRRTGIAMTTPVAQEPTSEKIAMTAPVIQTANEGTWIVRFTMPSAYTLGSLPQPDDPRIQLRDLPAERVAVLRFSGFASKDRVAEKTAELIAAADAHDLHTFGPVSLAQYNPPWTLWFMRRNEVMIKMEN